MKIGETLAALGGIVAVVTLIGFLFYYKVSVWNECRVDHSWFYCMQLISK